MVSELTLVVCLQSTLSRRIANAIIENRNVAQIQLKTFKLLWALRNHVATLLLSTSIRKPGLVDRRQTTLVHKH